MVFIFLAYFTPFFVVLTRGGSKEGQFYFRLVIHGHSTIYQKETKIKREGEREGRKEGRKIGKKEENEPPKMLNMHLWRNNEGTHWFRSGDLRVVALRKTSFL